MHKITLLENKRKGNFVPSESKNNIFKSITKNNNIMKKRLLLSIMALACMLGIQAADYVYSHTAKYSLEGENLVTNGRFTNGTDNWSNEVDGTISAEIWSVEPAYGPSGDNAIMSLSGSEGEGNALVGKWQVSTAGLYVMTFYIKGENTLTTSITAGTANYLDVFANSDGSLTKGTDATQGANAEPISDEWTLVAFPIFVESGQQVVFIAQRLATGVAIADISLRKATEVYDTRIAERLVAYVEELLTEEALPNGREEVEDALSVLKGALAEDDPSIQELVDYFQNDIFTQFLDNNGTNLIGTTLTDWKTWGSYNYSKLSTKDSWTFEGGRWGFTGATDYLEFSEADGYIASAGIQTGYTLDAGVRTRANYLDDLGPGKYFFAIEAQAVAAANRSNPYGTDHTVPIIGPTIFVGEDSTLVENDTLNGYYWKTYYKIAEIKEGEEIKMGFHFPVVDGKKGGRYSLRNPQVRLLGISPEQAEFNRQKKAFTVQQYNLNLRLTNYPEELKDYPWEKDSLTRAINHAQPIYDASLLIIDADGNVLDASQITEEKIQELLDEVNNLGKARAYIIAQNAPIDELKEAIEVGNASLNNPANANAAANKRSALQNAVNAGQALLDGITEVNQGEAFTAAAEAILAAKEEFESTSATRANPTEILIKNGDFSEFAAGNNVTAAGENKGWDWSMAASTSRWEIRDNETLSKGHGASVWRGTTVQLDGKVRQTADLSYEGIYEYRAKAYISEERIGELLAAAEIIYNDESVAIDTIYKPNIRLFFGEAGNPDSVTISKCYLGFKDDGTYFERESSNNKYPGQVYATYSVFFTKSGSTPTTVEFGLEATDNFATAGANGFGFGENQLFYLGSEAKYLTDTKADLNAEIQSARNAIAGVDNWWVTKANRYISDAATATTSKDMQNIIHSLKEIESRIQGNVDGVKGVFANETVKPSAQGVYTLTGVKVANHADNLKAGLYIVNGKKIYVK